VKQNANKDENMKGENEYEREI